MKKTFTVELVFKGEVEVEAKKDKIDKVLSDFLKGDISLYGGCCIGLDGCVSNGKFIRTDTRRVEKEGGKK